MTTDQLWSMIRTIPFRPYVIHMADGRQVSVSHPEAIAYSGGRTAVVVLPDDRFEIIDLLSVASLEGVRAESQS
jgi:hypothetical protein